MNDEKDRLRHQAKRNRRDLSKEDKYYASQKIQAKLLAAADWSKVKSLHFYEPIDRMGEVDISGFIKSVKIARPHIKLMTSKKIGGDWKTVELSGDVIDEPKPSVVIVPMLAFDDKLNRLGYGGGYYDRLLSESPKTKKIGVCYEANKVAKLPKEKHDVTLDLIITEVHSYR